MFDEILSIEEVGEIETIDIEVSGNHLFFANGILTHNSGYGQHSVEMDNIADSMGIAHTADLIISIAQPDELKENNQLKFEIIKSRISKTGSKGIVDVDYSRLKLISTPDANNNNLSNTIAAGITKINATKTHVSSVSSDDIT
jgi:hypothetical protein